LFVNDIFSLSRKRESLRYDEKHSKHGSESVRPVVTLSQHAIKQT
jgi:hypothetical protein